MFDNNFFTIELIISVFTIVLSPIVGRLIDWLLAKLKEYLFKQKNKRLESQVDELFLLSGKLPKRVFSGLQQAESGGAFSDVRYKKLKKLFWSVQSEWAQINSTFVMYPVNNKQIKELCRQELSDAKKLIDEVRIEINNLTGFTDKIVLERDIYKIQQAQSNIVSARTYFYSMGGKGTGYATGIIMAVIFEIVVLISLPKDIIEIKLLDLIPVSVLSMGLLGGMTYSLFLYVKIYINKNSRFEEPVKVFVFNPVFSMIIASILYLAVLTGLVIFGTSTSQSNPPLVALVSFLGGFFSDRAVNVLGRIGFTSALKKEDIKEGKNKEDSEE